MSDSPTTSDPGDPQDRAEQLDDDAVFGEDPAERHGLPGVNDFVDHVPMQSEDPALLMGGSETRDESHTREWREEPDVLGDPPADEIRLTDPGEAGPEQLDSEQELLGEASIVEDAEPSAEEAAMHIEERPGRR